MIFVIFLLSDIKMVLYPFVDFYIHFNYIFLKKQGDYLMTGPAQGVDFRAIRTALDQGGIITKDLQIINRPSLQWACIVIGNALRSIWHCRTNIDTWEDYRLARVGTALRDALQNADQASLMTGIAIFSRLKAKASVKQDAHLTNYFESAISDIRGRLRGTEVPPFEADPMFTSSSLSRIEGELKVNHEHIGLLRNAIVNFADKLGEKLSKAHPTESFCFSPLSIVAVLGMALCVVKDPKKILDGLCIGDFSIREIDVHAAISQILKNSALSGFDKGEISITQMAGYTPTTARTPALDQVVESFYNGKVVVSNDLSSTMNKVISEKTKGMIKNLLPADVYFAIVNAIYLNLKWKKPFELSKTYTRHFFGINGRHYPVKMMQQESTFKYVGPTIYSEKNIFKRMFKMLEKSYLAPEGHKMSYLIFLPTEVPTAEDLNDLRSFLTGNVIAALRNELAQDKQLKLHMPQTELRNRLELVTVLREMGIDLNDIDKTKYPDPVEVVHEAFMKTEEQGTVAAAATAMMVRETCVMDEIENFYVEHGHIVMVMKDDELLFEARVIDDKAFPKA